MTSPAIENPPRELTPLARRRAWNEPRTRAWWLIAIVMFVVAGINFTQEFLAWRAVHRAIDSGVTVQAVIVDANGDWMKGRRVTANAYVNLAYDYAGQHFAQGGLLTGRTEFITVGESVTIFVDPKHPEYWAYSNIGPSLSISFIVPILLFPIGLITLICAMLAHARVKQTWQHGELLAATVTKRYHNFLAPRCQTVQCAFAANARVVDVFLPPGAATMSEGETVDVLVLKSRRSVLAVQWFTE